MTRCSDHTAAGRPRFARGWRGTAVGTRPPRRPRPGLGHGHRVTRRTVLVLPTLFTLANLLMGFAAIFVASRPAGAELPFNWTPLTLATIFIFAGMVFDALDGRVARLTRSSSELGEQLDSMADMVTFGVAPAFIAIQLVGVQLPFVATADAPDRYFDRFAIVVACIYVACAALRLARFNLELHSREHDHASFRGLPTPGAAGTVASLVLLHQYFLARETDGHWTVSLAAIGMLLIMLLAALAMVSAMGYVHVVNRYVRGRAPVGTFAKGVIIGLLLWVHWQGALAAAFVVYALSAPVAAMYHTMRRGDGPR